MGYWVILQCILKLMAVTVQRTNVDKLKSGPITYNGVFFIWGQKNNNNYNYNPLMDLLYKGCINNY